MLKWFFLGVFLTVPVFFLAGCSSTIYSPPYSFQYVSQAPRGVPLPPLCKQNAAGQLVDLNDEKKGCPSQAFDKPAALTAAP